MIELEIQGLSSDREGLLIEVGRFALANGFTLQRQRLVQDPHGFLLTMVVRGPSRGRKALQAVLETYQRFISVQISPFVAGEAKPHFAASVAHAPYTPPPAPTPPAPPPSPPMASPAVPAAPVSLLAAMAADDAETDRILATVEPAQVQANYQAAPDEPELEFILPTPRAPAPPAEVTAPFVDVAPLEPDEAAVEAMLDTLAAHYPAIIPHVLALQQSVAEGARESSLMLAGRRTGQWVFQNEYLLDNDLNLAEAIERLGVPALHALTEVNRDGTQLQLLDSPLCSKDGPSGCSFFSGFLEGLLETAIAPETLSIFPVCCRSYGADACVLALSD